MLNGMIVSPMSDTSTLMRNSKLREESIFTNLGMSHTNLIHHFGSAAGLQSELMHQMMSELTAAIESAVSCRISSCARPRREKR